MAFTTISAKTRARHKSNPHSSFSLKTQSRSLITESTLQPAARCLALPFNCIMPCLIQCDYKLLEGRNNALYLSCLIHNSCWQREKPNTGARYKLFGMNRSRNLEDQESLILSFLLALTEMLSPRFLNSCIINFYRCHLFLRRYGALTASHRAVL